MSLTDVDPKDVFFTFSRLRPKFSCGRRVQDTLDAILANELRPEDLPPISVLLDPATGHMFSLNNRRLYVFKSLQAEGRLQTVPARVKPVPQTKRMKDKYTADKCAKTARLMLEREAVERLGSDDEAEGVNSDGEQGSQEKRARASRIADKAEGVTDDGEEQNGEKKAHASKQGDDSSPPKKPSKPAKPVRNMDDWTDEEDIGKKKRGKGKKGRQ